LLVACAWQVEKNFFCKKLFEIFFFLNFFFLSPSETAETFSVCAWQAKNLDNLLSTHTFENWAFEKKSRNFCVKQRVVGELIKFQLLI